MDQIWVVSEKTRQWGPSVSFTLNLEVTPHSLQLLRYSQKSSGTHFDYSHFPLCTAWCWVGNKKPGAGYQGGVSGDGQWGGGVTQTLSVPSPRHYSLTCTPGLTSLWNRKMTIFFCFFWPHNTAYGILVPWPGIKPISPALESWSLTLNHQGNPKRGTFETTLLKAKNRIFTSKN